MKRLLIDSGFVPMSDSLGSLVTASIKELVQLQILKNYSFFFKLSFSAVLDFTELSGDGLLGVSMSFNFIIPVLSHLLYVTIYMDRRKLQNITKTLNLQCKVCGPVVNLSSFKARTLPALVAGDNEHDKCGRWKSHQEFVSSGGFEEKFVTYPSKIKETKSFMMNTVRVELTEAISTDLNWKVIKGYRSAPRRSRKPVDRSQKLGAELAEKSARSPSETTVSESEKLGVAVLGRRFSDKIEHVPIKKRRFMVRSPSPPPHLSSPHLEDNQPPLDGRRASGQKSCPKSIVKKHPTRSDASTLTRLCHSVADSGVNENLNEVTNQKPGGGEDFSGIEILAAAACNNSINDDVNPVEGNSVGEDLSQDGKEASTSARPSEQTFVSTSSTEMRTASEVSEARDASVSAILEESVASLETVHSSIKDIPQEDKIESSSFEANGVRINPSEGHDEAVARSISSKDVRLHWDLNVTMDAWDEPCDMVIGDPQTTAVDDILMNNKQGSEALEIGGVEDAKDDIACTVQPLANNDEQGLKACPEFEMSYGKCIPADNALGPSKDTGMGAKASSQDASVDACVDHSPCDDITVTGPVSEETNKTAFFAVKHMTEDTAPGVQLGVTVCSESVEVENPAIACVPEGASCEIESTVLDDDGKGSGATSSFHDDPKSPEEMMGVESCHSLAPVVLEVKPVAKTEVMAADISKLDCDDKSASGASIGEGLSLVTLIAKEPVEAISETHTVDSLPKAAAGSSSGEQCHYGEGTTCSLGRVTTEDPCNDNYDLDVCQDDKDHMVGQEKTMEHEAGYESQYEDGELRESDVPYWEENEFEDEEAECVDYGSDTCDSDAAHDSISGKVGMGLECRETEVFGSESREINRNAKVVRGLSPGSDNMCEKNEHSLRQCSMGSKTKTSGSDQLPGDSEASSNRTAEATEGCTGRRHAANCFDGLGGKYSPAEVVGSVASNTLNRMGPLCARRRLHNFDMPIRSEEAGSDQSMGKEKSDSRMHSKSSGGAHLVNPSGGYWDSKRRGSPSYHGSFGSGRPRPKSVVESHGFEMDPDDTFSEAAGVHNRVRRQAISFSSNRLYQPPLRRRSPAERNDTHNMHRGVIPMRDTSPDRWRFRRYPQGVSRGIREEYHRPMPDDPNECSYNVPRRMARREQSTSPPGRGPIYYGRPYKKFQSRCRSRSPLSWGLPRERNDVSRHRGSRSPDYRLDSKIDKPRVPFQKHSFGAKYEVGGFMSPPKRRFSPQHNSRWFDDSNSGVDHNFRGRRLAGRRFQQGQRIDSVRSSRRLSSDDYFEPMSRPARFSELASGGGRECRYEGSDDDRRKHDGRFEIIHRVRRYDSDGVVRQFRYDEDDRFASRNTQNYDDCDNRAADRRPRDAYVGEIAKRRVN
ncbi:hypothetical protein ACE6H2_009059 [Prunus campanulata]